jgi:hypothetical protein
MTDGRRLDTCDAPHIVGCEFANASAEQAVKKTFAILGVDINNPSEVRKFQESLRFGDRLKKYADHGGLIFAGAMALALAAAIWMGVVAKIKGGPL